MERQSGLACVQHVGQITDTLLAVGQLLEDSKARGIRERVKQARRPLRIACEKRGHGHTVSRHLDVSTSGYGRPVRPEVGALDPSGVAAWFLDRLGRGSGAERVMALTWQRSGILEVARCPPQVTAAGKILPVLRRTVGRGPPAAG